MRKDPLQNGTIDKQASTTIVSTWIPNYTDLSICVMAVIKSLTQRSNTLKQLFLTTGSNRIRISDTPLSPKVGIVTSTLKSSVMSTPSGNSIDGVAAEGKFFNLYLIASTYYSTHLKMYCPQPVKEMSSTNFSQSLCLKHFREHLRQFQ